MADQLSIETWSSRDLPLLKHICAVIDTEESLPTSHLDPASTGMSESDVGRALRALDGEYLVIEWEPLHPLLNQGTRVRRDQGVIIGVTAAARREVGMWPSAESVTEQLLATLDEQIANSTDSDKRSKLIKIRDAIGGTARDLFVEIVGSAVSKTITGS